MSEQIIARLSKLDTCAVSDALDRLGLRGAAVGIRPLWASPKIAGSVVTVKLRQIGSQRPKQHLGVGAIQAAQPEDILVVDNAGRLDVGSWGGLLALAAKARQLRGVILDGACRDVDEIREIGLPVFARGAVPITARGRIVEESFNKDIQCGGVRVRASDYVIADGSGVVFIPSARAEEVIAAAEAIARRENEMSDAIRAGRLVSEVFLGAGYEGMLDQNQPEPAVAAFERLPVTAVSDALDRLGIHGTCLGISPLVSGYHVAGRAFTVKYELVGAERGTVGDYIDEVEAGRIVVLDNAGRMDATVWGDLLTLAAFQKGVAATVIDGVCRDTKRSIELRYPIFSRGKFMRTGKDRVRAMGVNTPVQIGGVGVWPGDILLGSDDGVVVIPQNKENEVLEVTQGIEETEEKIRAEILAGSPVREAREKYGYHQLQRKRG